MRVRITAPGGYSNPRRGIEFDTGVEAELPADLAVKLITSHIAVPAPKPIETAAAAPPQNAAKSVSKPKPKASRSSRPAKEEAE